MPRVCSPGGTWIETASARASRACSRIRGTPPRVLDGGVRVGDLAAEAAKTVGERLADGTTPAASVVALWDDDKTAVVVTRGADDWWFTSSDDRTGAVHRQPAKRVTVVETTGCGDVFRDAHATVLAKGGGVVDCVAAATYAAGECATHPGGIDPRSPAA